jgi:hypothetical protein
MLTRSRTVRLFALRVSQKHAPGTTFRDWGGEFSGDTDLLGTIEIVTLEKIFLEWMERLAKCININGEYVGWDE